MIRVWVGQDHKLNRLIPKRKRATEFFHNLVGRSPVHKHIKPLPCANQIAVSLTKIIKVYRQRRFTAKKKLSGKNKRGNNSQRNPHTVFSPGQRDYRAIKRAAKRPPFFISFPNACDRRSSCARKLRFFGRSFVASCPYP